MPEGRKVIRDCNGEGVFYVCIDGLESGSFWGSIGSTHLQQWVAFNDAGLFFVRLDQLLEEQGVPQAFHKLRRFKALGKKASLPQRRGSKAASCPWAAEQRRGQAATLTLCMTSRKDVSWQGYVEWLDTGRTHAFSSELELLRLILAHFEPEPEDAVSHGDKACF